MTVFIFVARVIYPTHYTLLFLDHPVGTISFASNDSEIEGVTEQVVLSVVSII